MSGLLYQNTNTRCRGWTNPNELCFGPNINSLSSYYSPAASNSLVCINGANFYAYSSVRFSTYCPTVYFINSSQLEFYVPSTLTSGNYTVQVFNGSTPSNIVNYTIDNASGYWMLDGNGAITNSNTSNGLNVKGNTTINGNLTITGTVISPSSTLSDYRIKSQLEPLTNYSVDNLYPLKYYNKHTNKVEIGFLAHEVQQQFPDLVTGEKDGPELQTLDYKSLIGVLVKEMKDLKAEIKELKSKA
jgi:hypothetical protein